MPRDGTKNLIPFTEETAKEMGRRGAIASAKSRRKQKTLKETMQLLISLNVSEAECKKIAKKLGLNEDQINYGLLMNFAQLTKAIKGDTRAAEFVRDTVGEKPVTNTNVAIDMEDLTPLAEMFKETEEEQEEKE